MIKFLKWTALTTAVIAAFFGGFYAKQITNIPTQPTNYADTTASMAALVGVIIAIVTITNWKKSKIQEDSYQLIKSYISELVLIETITTDIIIEVQSISPIAGNVFPSQSFVIETLQSLESLNKKLSKAHRQAHQIKSELPFWGIKLTITPENNHEALLIALYNFQIVSDVLKNNLYGFYISSTCSMEQVISEYNKLENHFHLINATLSERKAKKMTDMFTIK